MKNIAFNILGGFVLLSPFIILTIGFTLIDKLVTYLGSHSFPLYVSIGVSLLVLWVIGFLVKKI